MRHKRRGCTLLHTQVRSLGRLPGNRCFDTTKSLTLRRTLIARVYGKTTFLNGKRCESRAPLIHRSATFNSSPWLFETKIFYVVFNGNGAPLDWGELHSPRKLQAQNTNCGQI